MPSVIWKTLWHRVSSPKTWYFGGKSFESVFPNSLATFFATSRPATLTQVSNAVQPLRVCELILINDRRYGELGTDPITSSIYLFRSDSVLKGLIIGRKMAFLLKEDEASIEARKLVVDFVCHEVAHMWFGNITTMAWWDNLWVFQHIMAGKALSP